jgi:Glycosyl hydrolases family 39
MNRTTHTKCKAWLHAAWLCGALSAANGCVAAERVLTLTPAPGANVFVPAYFGIHVHNTGPTRRWPDIPIGSIRLWDARVTWLNLEPKPDQWDFSRLDEFVGWAESRHLEIVLPLGVTPRWASSRPDEAGAYGAGTAAEPADIAAWRAYVKKVVLRYRGRVAAYEIWNEANIKQFYSGTLPSLARLTIAAADEIRRADPAARVIAPSGVGLDSRVEWPSQLLSLGVASVVDAVAYHAYHASWPPESMIEPLLKLKAANKAAGFEALPLWNTEFGYWMPTDGAAWSESERQGQVPEQTVADYLPRDLLLAAALGFRRFFWYAWDNRKMGLLDPETFAHRRAATVYEQSIRQLGGWALESCGRDSVGLWTCKLTSPTGGRMLALWIDPKAKDPVQSLPAPQKGKWLQLDGLSNWTALPSELKVGSVVTLVSDQK